MPSGPSIEPERVPAGCVRLGAHRMPSLARSRTGVTLTLAIVAGGSAVAASYGMLSGFSSWDDEGALMMTVRQFLGGGTLYRNVSTGYGPVYYFYNWIIRALSLTSVTHDSTRLTAAAIWTICALMGAAIVWRFGHSLAAAAIAWLLIFRTLSLFRNEPGHPQELCMLLLLGTVGAFSWCDDERWMRTALAGAGVLAASLLLVKINIGIFAVVAIVLGIANHVPGKWLRCVSLSAAVALPFALMKRNAADPDEIIFVIAVTAGIAALAVRPGIRGLRLGWPEGVAAAAGFSGALALGLIVCVRTGIHMSSMLDALVLHQWRMRVDQVSFYIPARIGTLWILFPIAGIAAAAYFRKKSNLGWVPFAAGAIGLLAAALPGNQSLAVITPCCWMVAFTGADRMLGRSLLAALATVQTLYIYPVAGSQAAFARVLLVVVAALLVADRLHGWAIDSAAVTVVLVAVLFWSWQSERHYRAMTPLNLPGARLVRLDAVEAAEYQSLTRSLRQHCDTFIGYPGLPSLYAWTGEPMPGPANDAPGPLSADVWNLWLTQSEQQAVMDEFARHPHGCVVYSPAGVAFWNRPGVDDSGQPLVRFIRENFVTIDRIGDYQLQARKERPPAGSEIH